MNIEFSIRDKKEKLIQIAENIANGSSITESIETCLKSEVNIIDKYNLYKHYENVFNGIEYIADFLKDKTVTDILINNDGKIWVDSSSGIKDTNKRLPIKKVKELAIRIANMCDKRLDESSPIADGILPNGIRFNAILDPVSLKGTCISFRIKPENNYSFQNIFNKATPHYQIKNIVKQIVESKVSFVISGATGTGKTTLLSTLTEIFKENERILFIEEINEIVTSHSHSVFLQTKSKNIENKGEITLSDLVHAAMRMRPDRIILGECRGKEIADILNAFNTGHEGGICTIHANSIEDIPSRILSLGKLANLDIETITYQSFSALKLAIHLERKIIDGKIHRWIKEIGMFAIENNKLKCIPCIQITQKGEIVFLEHWKYLKEIIHYYDDNN